VDPSTTEQASKTKAKNHVRHEWRVTGFPDGDYPFYDFTWRSDRVGGHNTEEEARLFVERCTEKWSLVKLQHRIVIITAWEDI